MAKLYFRYGTMRSAKTLNLLAVAHNYRSQGKTVWLAKPATDFRDSVEDMVSRTGLRASVDMLLGADQTLDHVMFSGLKLSCLLVDEAQFLTVKTVNSLRKVATHRDIPVICYGLRTDFQSHLFEGSKRLLELADSIEEIKTVCDFCEKKATMNMRVVNQKPTIEGPQVFLGGDETYLPVCFRCYWWRIGAPITGIFGDVNA